MRELFLAASGSNELMGNVLQALKRCVKWMRQPGALRWIVWTALALGSLCFFWIYGNSAHDDSYITFRYARNLLLGRGFVYNPGEHVLGTSTPLYTILLALLAWLSGLDVVRCAWLLGLVSLWIGAGLLYEIGEGNSPHAACAASFIYISLPFLRLMVGMESFFLLALTIAAVWFFQRDLDVAASVLCGLLVLVRIEMVFLVILLAAFSLISRRRIPTWIWPAAAIPAIWFAWAAFYFGSPLPNSAFAKLLAARHSFLVGLFFHWIDLGFQVWLFKAWPGFLILGVYAVLRRRTINLGYTLLLLWGVVYTLVVSALAGSFPWYYAPLLPAFAILSAQSIANMLELEKNKRAEPTRVSSASPLKVGTALYALFLVGFLGVQLTFWMQDWGRFHGANMDRRAVPYHQAADWLRSKAGPSDILATGEIGYLGYYSDMTILDVAGLVSPQLLPFVNEGYYGSLALTIEAYSPDYVLVADHPTTKGILSDDPRYTLVERIQPDYLIYHLEE